MPDTETLAQETKQDVEDVAELAKDKYADAQKRIRAQAKETWSNSLEKIRKEPLKSIGLAVGAGLLIGLSMASRRQK